MTALQGDLVRLQGPLPRPVLIVATLGVLALVAAVVLGYQQQDHWNAFLHSWLVSYVFLLGISLGALFLVILQHLGRAGWSVVVRRLAEVLATGCSLMLLFSIPLVAGAEHLYPWTHPVEGDALLAGKAPYLNLPFFFLRLGLCFLVWIVLARTFLGLSVQQDQTGEVGLTRRLEQLSAPAMILFGVTITVAAFDLLMSLDPHWFSTIYGVYLFSGSVVAALAALILLVAALQGAGYLRRSITAEHYHDLGKWLFAFTCFWAYIAFSQYMLIWYANLPEETSYFQPRYQGGWAEAGVLLLAVGHFLVPFLALMSRHAKRRRGLLTLAALWLLAMHWFDLYWLVMPAGAHGDPHPPGHHGHLNPVLDAVCLVGMVGVTIGLLVWRLRGCALLPLRDPRLPESLAFENY